MKRLCKDINLLSYEFIENSVIRFLREKKNRFDTAELLFSQDFNHEFRSIKELHNVLKSDNWIIGAKNVIDQLIKNCILQIQVNQYNFEPIKYHKIYDYSSKKEREIGVESIKQQLFDYIVVDGIRPLLKRLGTYQCASIPNRGPLYGLNAIKRWLRNPDNKYIIKMDIHHCYESIKKEYMMEFLRKHVKNSYLLDLIYSLLSTYRDGLSIGSYLSQYLCNLYMSQLYHIISETYLYKRRNKNINIVNHVLIYMDDILVIGKNRKKMKEVAYKIIENAAEFHLKVKPNWRFYQLDSNKYGQDCIDMLGYRIYRTHAILRKKTYHKIHNLVHKIKRYDHNKLLKVNNINNVIHKLYSLMSYHGYLMYTNTYNIIKDHRIFKYFGLSKYMISKYTKKKYR